MSATVTTMKATRETPQAPSGDTPRRMSTGKKVAVAAGSAVVAGGVTYGVCAGVSAFRRSRRKKRLMEAAEGTKDLFGAVLKAADIEDSVRLKVYEFIDVVYDAMCYSKPSQRLKALGAGLSKVLDKELVTVLVDLVGLGEKKVTRRRANA